MKDVLKIEGAGMGRGVPTVWVSLGNPQHKQAIVERVRDLGWRVVDLDLYVGNLPPGPAPHGAFVDQLPDAPQVTDLLAQGCCVIRIGRLVHPDDGLLTSVIPDRAAAGRLAAEHLADRHFRHVGFVCYPQLLDNPYAAVLYEAFSERAGELGCECHTLVFEQIDPRQHPDAVNEQTKYLLRQAEAGRWLQSVPKPIGVFTFGDMMAGRLAIAAQEQAIEIPQQVALLGRGGERVACVSAPVPLSTVDVGLENLCDTAIRLMEDSVNGKPIPSGAVLVPPLGVVVRNSTDVLASSDPQVALAIRFIWENPALDIAVDDVAQAVSMSRRSLERIFRENMDCGVNAVLQRRRLERCCFLLRTTDLSVTDIAPMLGYRSKDYLHALFRKTYGITPRQYRIQQAG